MRAFKQFRFICFISTCLLTACSGHLNRKEALRQIVQGESYKSRALVSVDYSGPFSDEFSSADCVISKSAETLWSQHEGFIAISGSPKFVSLTEKGRAASFPIRPQEQGKCGHPRASWDLYERANPSVLGIVEEGTKADVDYQFEVFFKNGGQDLFTDGPFYTMLRKEPYAGGVVSLDVPSYLQRELGPFPIPQEHGHYLVHRTAQFVRYDDGWRIQPAKN